MFSRQTWAVALGSLALLSAAAFLPQPSFAQSADTAARRAQLQSQLDQLEKQIDQTQGTLTTLHGQHQSIQRDIDILTAQIKQAQLQIQATQVQLDALDEGIGLQTATIGQLTGKLNDEQQSLAQIIRETREVDDYSLVELALSSQDLSGFFSDLDSFAALDQQLKASSDQLTRTRAATETQKDALVSQKTQKAELQQLQIAAQQKVKSEEAQKAALLAQTKKAENATQTVLNTQQKTAAQIRAELFALAGGSGQIPLPTAIQFAQEAQRLTGVRAAFVLAILSQESDLGKNVGQCYVTDLSTGNGVGKNTGTPFQGVMKSPRDTVPFQQIMDALGRDWSTTPVSCPIAGVGGYGGAMGPTQFIPSTWVTLQNALKSKLGLSATDPWNPEQAIVATGIYISNLGGTNGNYAAEHTAAAKYYAGGAWASSGQPYANSVMAKADQFQQDIDTLAGG